MLKIGVIIISISVNKCCNHDKIAISPIFKMAAAAILDFEKTAIVGAWHHPDLISRGSEDSKTSNTCFFKGVKLGFLRTTVNVFNYSLFNFILPTKTAGAHGEWNVNFTYICLARLRFTEASKLTWSTPQLMNVLINVNTTFLLD